MKLPSFSERYGYSSKSKEITTREGAPESLRYFVLETARDVGCEPFSLRSIVCRKLGLTPYYQYDHPDGVWKEIQTQMYECSWFKVYDIIEAFYSRVLEDEAETASYRGDSYGNGESARFADSINSFCVEHGIGWQLVNGSVVIRGDDAFERSIEIADKELSNRQTARKRIQEAISDLSRRPEPDLPGAISHAFAAMECIIGDIEYTPEEIREHTNHTFGIYLQRHADLFPSEDFKDGFQRLWKYANNEGSRHGKEGVEPARDETELIVLLAAALVTYLNRKHPK